MNRRYALKLLTSLSFAPLWLRAAPKIYDVVVVGAGVFGIWTAQRLHRAGKRVAVVEAAFPAHSNAPSGGESRVTRSGYGAEQLYSEWAYRSLNDWRALSERARLPLFHELGVIWLYRDGDPFVDATLTTFKNLKIPFQQLGHRQIKSRYPIMEVTEHDSAILEPHGGGIMARRSVQHMAVELQEQGVVFLRGEVRPIDASMAKSGTLTTVETKEGEIIAAEQFVFACGTGLAKVCPQAMAGRLFATRQDVIYFSAQSTVTKKLPVWADLPYYGLPSLEGRGFKVANDTHGEPFVADSSDRYLTQEAIEQARVFLARRFPSLADFPVSESRVCQYENSSNGDFVIDLHPGFDNVWVVGCGSGHGFKHGPALGTHVAGLVLGQERKIQRFALANKSTEWKREIQ